MDYEEIQAEIAKGVDDKQLRKGPARKRGLTLRERWRRTMFFQKVDCIPNFEFGYWAETLTVWHEQGLPRHITDEESAYAYFGIETSKSAPVDVMGLRPGFEHKIIEEDDDYVTYRNEEGTTERINKKGDKSIPQHLDFHLKDRKTWEEYKWRLKAGPDRVPANWPQLVEAYNNRDYPLATRIGSMIGVPRNWIGFEGIAMMVYDDPELLEEIVETLCCLVCDSLQRVLSDVEFDFAAGWEDICFNSGPIVGVPFMRDVVAPRYKRITDLLHKHGCHVAWTDTDGNIVPIVDSFLAGGINCMFPVEVHGGSDPVLLRKRWPGLLLQGGVCKMRIAEGPEAIRAEMKRLLPLVKEGGFLPGFDHRVPSNIRLSDYLYYMKLKRDLFGVGGKPQYDESKIG
jgi:uroporphyrinogen decarboxylase